MSKAYVLPWVQKAVSRNMNYMKLCMSFFTKYHNEGSPSRKFDVLNDPANGITMNPGEKVFPIWMSFGNQSLQGRLMFRKVFMISILMLLAMPLSILASGEGTRHITGIGKDIYFMDDKVFGTVNGHPLWAVYNCGSDIKGKIDIKGTYHDFSFRYQNKPDRLIIGEFGPLKMALGNIRKMGREIIYRVFVGDKEYSFSIRYERIEDEHMINSIIEGGLENGKRLHLTVDGHLCPFATTGIIMIVVGSAVLS